MNGSLPILILLGCLGSAVAEPFRHIGDFAIHSKLKITGAQVVPVAIKPLTLSVYTDGLTVRISAADDSEHASEYEIYRSDGIGRQTSPGGALEVVPGVQAVAEKSGVFRQLRLTQDGLTITTFPGVSDQIVVTQASLVPPPQARPVEEAPTQDASP